MAATASSSLDLVSISRAGRLLLFSASVVSVGIVVVVVVEEVMVVSVVGVRPSVAAVGVVVAAAAAADAVAAVVVAIAAAAAAAAADAVAEHIVSGGGGPLAGPAGPLAGPAGPLAGPAGPLAGPADPLAFAVLSSFAVPSSPSFGGCIVSHTFSCLMNSGIGFTASHPFFDLSSASASSRDKPFSLIRNMSSTVGLRLTPFLQCTSAEPWYILERRKSQAEGPWDNMSVEGKSKTGTRLYDTDEPGDREPGRSK